MEKNYKTLYESSEKQCILQDQIIQKQSKLIHNLEAMNTSLKEENDSLRSALKQTQDICDRQQELLDAAFSSSK